MLLGSDSYAQFLGEELVRRIRTNPRYSQRAFARHLGLSPGELSEILRGRRKLSLKATFKVGKALGLSPAEVRHLGFLVQRERGREIEKISNGETSELLGSALSRSVLSLDLFHVISDWFCFAILNLADCEGFRWEEKWISGRLGISIAETRVGIERLERVGLIERRNGKRIVCKDYLLSPEGVPSEAIRNYHRQMLERAIHSLDQQSVEEREIAGIDFAVNPAFLPAMKKDISDFLDEMVAKYARGRSRTEVYHCETALFRLTQRRGKEN